MNESMNRSDILQEIKKALTSFTAFAVTTSTTNC